MTRFLSEPALGRQRIRRAKCIRDIGQVPGLPPSEQDQLAEVAGRYAFRANDYYLSLIDWDDPADPIRQLIIPRVEELNDWGKLDVSNEASVTVAQGVQHKYPHTVVLLCNEVCGGYCRYCFRKRLFLNGKDEVTRDVSKGLQYIAQNPNVTNVLLTGGDPLLMSTRKLVEILAALRAIPHVRIIRIGTKMLAFDPWRVLDDSELLAALGRYSQPRNRIYIMTHFDHPRELTNQAVQAVDCLLRSGVICANQCPLVKGVNDNPKVLSDLYRELSFIGCPPYYLFQCRPTAGNKPYVVPIVQGWHVFREAIRHGSGLARRARYVMSRETGKIEFLGIDDRHVYLRYHRAKDAALRGQLMTYERNDEACWLDELRPSRESDAMCALCLADTPSDHESRTSCTSNEDGVFRRNRALYDDDRSPAT